MCEAVLLWALHGTEDIQAEVHSEWAMLASLRNQLDIRRWYKTFAHEPELVRKQCSSKCLLEALWPVSVRVPHLNPGKDMG